MATRGRETAPGKEKRGTSSSLQPHSNTQQNHRPSLSRPRVDPGRKHDTPASYKHVTHHLRGSVSSSPDGTSKQLVKKQVSTSSGARKPNLVRTISLDQASLSPSSTPKARTSARPTLRSSSFSSKTGIAQKSLSDKLVKSPNDGVTHQPLYSRSVSSIKKSSIPSKKREPGIGASTRREKAITPPERVVTVDISEVPQLKTLQDEQEFSVIEAEEIINAGSNNEIVEDVPVLECSEPECIREIQPESHEDEEVMIVECSSVSEDQDMSTEVKLEEPADVSVTEGMISSNQQDSDQENADEKNETETNGDVTSSPIVEAERNKGESSQILDKKEEVTISGEMLSSEGTKKQGVAEEVKQKVENKAPRQPSNRGKDSAVSNDVIEETASKLREQRRNKVKALAGAFETVISLQEPK